MNCVLFEPHADDAALFSSFNIIRYSPHIVTVFGSSGDYGPTDVRHAETVAAMSILGGGPCEQWDGDHLQAKMRDLDERLRPTIVFAPDMDSSHIEHRLVTEAAALVFGSRVRWYHTYNDMGKVRDGDPVPFETGWASLKRQALACYKTQIAHPRARKFFEEYDLAEYMP